MSLMPKEVVYETVGQESEPLDEFHAHEALDRTWMVMELFGVGVSDHEYITRDSELDALANAASAALMALYQAIGRKRL